MTDVDEGLRSIASAVHVLSRTLRRAAEKQIALDPISGSEFEVLHHLGAHPGSSVSDVARALRSQTSNVSTTVRGLVDRGLLDRVPDAHDQRRIHLWPSAEAQQQREVLESTWSAMLARLLGELPTDEADRLRAAVPGLTKLAQLVTREMRTTEMRTTGPRTYQGDVSA